MPSKPPRRKLSTKGTPTAGGSAAFRGRHDEAYRKIFGDRHMMIELIRGFFPPALLEGWKLETLERKDTHWIDGQLRHRSGDLVWRVQLRESVPDSTQPSATGRTTAPQRKSASRRNSRWIYLYILLELQSRPDARMPLRALE